MALHSTINELALCAGAGGLTLGLKLIMERLRTVAYVERDAYAAATLVARMEDTALDPAPIWDDVTTFDGSAWRGIVDLVTAGYPCQPFSSAGKRRGADDPRHLWPHIARVVDEVRPHICFFENVANHLILGFRDVRDELQSMGYRVAAGLYTAAETGAPHERKRLFILAYAGPLQATAQPGKTRSGAAEASEHQAPDRPGDRRDVLDDSGYTRPRQSEPEPVAECDAQADDRTRGAAMGNAGSNGRIERRTALTRQLRPPQAGSPGGLVGDPYGERPQGFRGADAAGEWTPWPPGLADAAGWERYLERFPGLEPAVRRGAHGLAHRVDRLRLCGNGVVPVVAALAFLDLWEQLHG